ncbi:uncharacterized protein LOC109846644 [Asparagus officinalis]|uniref:uncharacterized protein LOC109846644 n=1 Tax=Asparagus officinalis TaxID=4686 RepID=UPI00098E5562|nr:uncharacterized protein LOC109846644 [Asparagus officinalis]
MHGLQISVGHFLRLFEIYNPDTNTFFTKNGELGLALYEMMKVSGLPIGDVPYQEFFPTTSQLNKMKDRSSVTHETLWELTCHYHIAMAEMETKARKKSPQVSLKQFADYLFKNLEDRSGEVCGLSPLSPGDINRLLEKTNAQSYTSHSEDGFSHGTKFRSYLFQAGVPIRPTTLLAGFLAIWLKRCVVPHQSSDAMPMEVLYPAVQLATGRRLSLLPAMVAAIHSGLRQLVSAFTQEKKKPSASISVPKLELPYTYLMTWLVLHRPDLMEAPETVDPSLPLLQTLEGCKWINHRWPDITRQFKIHKCWEFFPCFPRFSGTYNTTLLDAEDPRQNRTVLDVGCFRWLMNIRPGYLLFRAPPLRMTFLFCKWLIAANIVTRRGRVSDSEEEAAPQQATEATHEAMVSTRGKEAAESSRKGKEPVLPAGSEEEFDSEETETSEDLLSLRPNHKLLRKNGERESS